MQDSINTVRNAMKSQFDTSWSLLEFHLNDLTDEICHWRPCSKGLFVERQLETWYSDWPDSEEYEIGPPNIAWLTWHIIFWWSMALDYSFGSRKLKREDVRWPGSISETKKVILKLHDDWVNKVNALANSEFVSFAYTNWPIKNKPFYELAAWLNIELMKNASEIGYCRFLYASQKTLPSKK